MNQHIQNANIHIDMHTGLMHGNGVSIKKRYLSDLQGVFADEDSRKKMNQDMLAYEVQLFLPVEEGTGGGLYFGNTTIYPGKVGAEYMMTKGHFHAKRNRNEYYLGVRGTGLLLFMDQNRECRVEHIKEGSLHYIGENLAHRVINTGTEPLTFLASWPADAGHDYDSIQQHGFSMRIIEENGHPKIIKA